MQPIHLSFLFVAAFIHCLVFQCVCSVDTSGDDLVERLCGSTHSEVYTAITLNHSTTYSVTSNRSCLVKNTSLTIHSDSPQYPAYVDCANQVSSDPISTVSFAFLSVNLTIKNIVFTGCGAQLSRFPKLAPNLQSSSLHFSDSHSAFLVFIDSAVVFSRVGIINYFGFGVIGINLERSIFFNTSFNQSIGEAVASLHNGSIGSGMLILFTEAATSLALRSRISIDHSNFFANYEITLVKDRQCVVHHFSSYSRKSPSRIISAAALTVIFSNVQPNGGDGPVVSLRHSYFKHNYGSYCSGLMVLLLNSATGVVEVAQNHFETNVNMMECIGSHLTFFATAVSQPFNMTITPLIVNATRFEKNSNGLLPSPYKNIGLKLGSVLIGVHHSKAKFEFLFEQVTFSKNEGPLFGTAMAALVYNRTKASNVRVNVILKSVTVKRNNHINFNEIIVYGGGILAFSDIDNVTIIGTAHRPSKFTLNNGSAIKAINSNVFLKGHVLFRDNKSIRGAALSLLDSLLYFEAGLVLEASNNSVLKYGGAIFVVNIGIRTYELPNCALQFPSNNISCTFAHNNASFGGSSIYAYPLYSCYNKRAIVRMPSSYSKYLNFTTKSTKVKHLSTQAQTLVKCDDMSAEGFVESHYYPGQTIQIWMHASGNGSGAGSSVHTEVSVRLVRAYSDSLKMSSSEIKNSEKIQAIEEDRNCTKINVTIAYKGNRSNDEEGLPAIVVSAFMVSAIIHFPQSLINSSCPPGFQLSMDSGYCECSNAVKEFFRAVYSDQSQCNIQNITIPRAPYIASPWLGNVWLRHIGKTVFGLTDLCPFSYCTTNLAFKGFKYDEKSQSFKLMSSDGLIDICREHREGTLCGNCTKNYSVVFGADECMKCSNFWLLTIILYALSGPLIILVLYSLNLTLTTGTINGIVFFGQAANVNILPFLSYFPAFRISRRFMSVFLSMLNFNLGFPLCFYDGMTEVHKMTISLAFPVYLFTIILIIIIASRYSTRLSTQTSSRSVQVLATVVHISMGNLILSATNVFIRVQIYVDDDTTKYVRLWYRYPSASTRDLIILISFTVAIVSVVVIPYFTLLIGGRWLLRYTFYSNNFRPIYEAIHGPYKENRNYWFLARLVLLIIMFIFYTVWRGRELHLIIALTMSVLVLFIVIQECLKPFKNKIIGILDTTVMMCMAFLYILGWYQTIGLTSPNIMLLYDLLLVPVGIVFLLFLLVLGYHITMTLCPKSRLASLRSLPPIRVINSEQSAFLLSETVKDEEENEKEPCNYREPLLGSDSD